jgi:tetratricopeptide (TPR) repeat protein
MLIIFVMERIFFDSTGFHASQISFARGLCEDGHYSSSIPVLESRVAQTYADRQFELYGIAVNELSCAYRLKGGSLKREGYAEVANVWFEKAIDVYPRPEGARHIDFSHPQTLRARARALLCAGYHLVAECVLRVSIDSAWSEAEKGDDMCHLGALLVQDGRFDEACELLKKGSKLIIQDGRRAEYIAFGAMTYATIVDVLGDRQNVLDVLDKGLAFANINDLKIEGDIFEYLFREHHAGRSVNVLGAIGVY